LKPALIEVVFCAILAVSIYSPSNILLLMSRRYMKGVEFNSAQLAQMKKSMKAMLVMFTIHIVLILYSVFFLSKEAWAFISGGLFYLLFGAYFVTELVRNRLRGRRWRSAYGDDEWFDLVDTEGQVVGRAPRTVCHSGPGMLHPVVHMHVVDSRDRIYLQKRAADKQIQPGKWDTAVGGHIQSGEKVEDALKRETAEELGLHRFEARFVSRYVWETGVESELVLMFLCRTDKAIQFNREEIEDGRFWKVKKIRENLGKGLFTPNFEHEFPILLDALKQK
jgi:isopentenyldiphosphate isomerase